MLMTVVAVLALWAAFAPTAPVGEPVLRWQTWPIQGANALGSLSLISATAANVIVDVEIRG